MLLRVVRVVRVEGHIVLAVSWKPGLQQTEQHRSSQLHAENLGAGRSHTRFHATGPVAVRSAETLVPVQQQAKKHRCEHGLGKP